MMLLALLVSQACASRGANVGGWREASSAKLRELGVPARGAPVVGLNATLEARDEILSAALRELAVIPGPVQHRRVAERYLQLKILDAAHDHFTRARELDPTDAAAYDGLARVWRDSGFPGRGLVDAYRSVYYARASATAHNTLGTILAALGRETDARKAYERALQLDPRAAYVLNNLCYLSFLEGQIA